MFRKVALCLVLKVTVLVVVILAYSMDDQCVMRWEKIDQLNINIELIKKNYCVSTQMFLSFPACHLFSSDLIKEDHIMKNDGALDVRSDIERCLFPHILPSL